MQVKLKLPMQTIFNEVGDDDLCDIDALTFVEVDGITTVTGRCRDISDMLSELENYADVDTLLVD
jgi:hypothetical protein